MALPLVLAGTTGTRSQVIAEIPIRGDLVLSDASFGLQLLLETTLPPMVMVIPGEGERARCSPLTLDQEPRSPQHDLRASHRDLPFSFEGEHLARVFVPPGDKLEGLWIRAICPCSGMCTPCKDCVDPARHFLRVKESRRVRAWYGTPRVEGVCAQGNSQTRARITLDLPTGAQLFRERLRMTPAGTSLPQERPPVECYPAVAEPSSPPPAPAAAKAVRDLKVFVEAAPTTWKSEPFPCTQGERLAFEMRVIGPCPDAAPCPAPDNIKMSLALGP